MVHYNIITEMKLFLYKKCVFWTFFLCSLVQVSFSNTVNSDSLNRLISAEVGLSLNTISNNAVPLWMRSNKYGSIPLSGNSMSILGSVQKDYNSSNKIVDWGAKVNGRLNIGHKAEFIPVEAYIKGKLSIFQIKVGRSYEKEGLVDSLLSSGSFTLSGNALGIPKVEISIPDYWSIPLTSKLIAIKGNISYGWMGKLDVHYGANKGDKFESYFHHLSFYGRLGRPEDRWKFYGAINHDVIWGSDDEIFDDQYNLSKINEFWHVLSGKAYVPPKGFEGQLDISKIGNHLGSIDVGGEYKFNKFKVNVYRQFFYDKGAIGHLANLKDGLNGLVIENLQPRKRDFYWRKFLVELFYSKHQAGDYGAKKTPSGPEYYYNHGVYTPGFSYKDESIGTPLITPNKYARDGLPNHNQNHFISNRVIAMHGGANFDFNSYSFIIKGTMARHYGDFKTSGPDFQWFNGKLIGQDFRFGKFKPVNQFSGYIHTERNLRNGLILGGELGGDYGRLYKNSLGFSLLLKKQF